MTKTSAANDGNDIVSDTEEQTGNAPCEDSSAKTKINDGMLLTPNHGYLDNTPQTVGKF